MSSFPSRPKITEKDKVVAFRCRNKSGCDSMQAIVRKPTAQSTHFICVKCGAVKGVPQGGNAGL